MACSPFKELGVADFNLLRLDFEELDEQRRVDGSHLLAPFLWNFALPPARAGPPVALESFVEDLCEFERKFHFGLAWPQQLEYPFIDGGNILQREEAFAGQLPTHIVRGTVVLTCIQFNLPQVVYYNQW